LHDKEKLNACHSYNDHISKVAITCINKTIINL